MSNRHKNQHFGTLDLIMLVVLCGVVSTVIGASVAGLLRDNRAVRARNAAHTLALQIKQQHETALQSKIQTSRAPASIGAAEVPPPFTDGQIGRDPWGRPFFYSVLTGKSAASPMAIVWSAGPNGLMESNLGELNDLNGKEFRFNGDDVGYVADSVL